MKTYIKLKKQSVSTLGLCFVLGLLLCGCGQQQGNMTIEQITVPNLDKASAMEISETVLAEMHFEIEKADTNSGYIRTRPLPGAQFFELWRSDNAGANNWLMSNLHSVRRTVEINISRNDGQLQVDCSVHVQRLSVPESQNTSVTSGRAYRMFSKSKPTLQRLTLYPEQEEGMAWEDLGADEQLSTEILKRIEKRIGTATVNTVSRTNEETTGSKT